MSRNLAFLRFLRLRPFDETTETGRSNERLRRIVLSAAASALAKLLSIFTTLISVPLTLGYLGSERYGMWMTMSSLIAMLGFADLGIGNGVLTAVARAHGRDDREAIRRYVSSGLFVLSGIAAIIVIAFAACYAYVDWYRIFNVKGALARSEAAPALAVFVLGFAIAIPNGIVQRTQMGLQLGFTASLWQCAASLLGLAGVILAVYLEGGLVWLVAAFVGGPAISSFINSVIFFAWQRRDISPQRGALSWVAMREVAGAGSLFMILQIVMAVTYSSDGVLIAQLLGPEAVTQYAVPDRLFSLVTMCVLMMVNPLWAAYGEAIARGDLQWVRTTLRRSLLTTFMFATATCGMLVVSGDWLIRHWARGMVEPPLLLLLSFALWRVIESIGSTLSIFLNGAGLLRFQVAVAIPLAIVALGLKLLFTSTWGVPTLQFSTSFAWLVCAGIPLYVYVRRLPILKVGPLGR